MTCRYDKRLYYDVQIYEKDWETNEEKRIKVLAQNGFPLILQFRTPGYLF